MSNDNSASNFRFLIAVTPRAYGVDVQWVGIRNTRAVYHVQYRRAASDAEVLETANFLRTSVDANSDWPLSYALTEASKVVHSSQTWRTNANAVSETAVVKLIRVQGLQDDTVYDFRVIAFTDSTTIVSPPVRSNTANISTHKGNPTE